MGENRAAEPILHVGDCRKVMAGMEADSVDAIVTDPPYELNFMSKSWDRSGIAYDGVVWREALRVAKPGAFLLAFGGTRTFHRLACAIEDAGWSIRDTIMWVYFQGFPKSLDVSKQLDKAAGAEREVVLSYERSGKSAGIMGADTQVVRDITAPATAEAQEWAGWGTALKPSYEPILLCRKPLTTVPIDGILIAESQTLIGGLLCRLLSNAKNAVGLSMLSPSGSGAVSASALMLAAVLHGAELGELFAETDMCSSRETASTCLSIALSWSGILDALSIGGSTFTTPTGISLTTALRTLNCLLSKSIPEATIEAVSRPLGSQSHAGGAGASFSGESESTNDTRTAFAAVLASLPHATEPTSAKSAAAALLPTILAVDSVLSHALQQLTTESGAKIRPNAEPIIVARKPFPGNVAANVLRYGTGAINVDGCRIEGGDPWANKGGSDFCGDGGFGEIDRESNPLGRWPANMILDGSPEVESGFPETESGQPCGKQGGHSLFIGGGGDQPLTGYGDSGSAARFFKSCPFSEQDDEDPYFAEAVRLTCYPKADRTDREEGLDDMPLRSPGECTDRQDGTAGLESPRAGAGRQGNGRRNDHATVKPTLLMRYLCRLVTPKGGTILDPFMGSGSTGKAAVLEGFEFIGIDLDAHWIDIAQRRISWAQGKRGLFAEGTT